MAMPPSIRAWVWVGPPLLVRVVLRTVLRAAAPNVVSDPMPREPLASPVVEPTILLLAPLMALPNTSGETTPLLVLPATMEF